LKVISFNQLRNAAGPVDRFIGRVLALDPGETTGAALFDASELEVTLLATAQIKTWPLHAAVSHFERLLELHKPTVVVYEKYHIYEWKAEDHSWSSVPTIQIIGCLKTLCIQRKIPYGSQTAQVAKQFCTDEKLETWNFYKKGEKHARDAVRHGCYFLLFGNKGLNNLTKMTS
jgi:hypothetical protein